MRLVKRQNVEVNLSLDYCSCCNKKSYWSESEAERVKQYLLDRNEASYLRVYKCPERMGYHLTSKYRD